MESVIGDCASHQSHPSAAQVLHNQARETNEQAARAKERANRHTQQTSEKNELKIKRSNRDGRITNVKRMSVCVHCCLHSSICVSYYNVCTYECVHGWLRACIHAHTHCHYGHNYALACSALAMYPGRSQGLACSMLQQCHGGLACSVLQQCHDVDVVTVSGTVSCDLIFFKRPKKCDRDG